MGSAEALASATEKLAEHGRTAHRAHEQWKNDVKKMAGAAPPSGPAVRADGKKGATGDSKARRAYGEPGVGPVPAVHISDSDSSDGELARAAADEAKPDDEEAQGATGVDRSFNGDSTTHRPSFLAV